MLHHCCYSPRAVIIIMTTIIIITITISANQTCSDSIITQYRVKSYHRSTFQGVRSSSACQFMVLSAERQAYMTWVQFNIATVPVISTVCYNIWFFICSLIKHTLLTVTAVTLWKHSSASFFMLSLAQSQFHTI